MSELSIDNGLLSHNARLLKEVAFLRSVIGRAEAALGPVENGAPAVSRELLLTEQATARVILQEAIVCETCGDPWEDHRPTARSLRRCPLSSTQGED